MASFSTEAEQLLNKELKSLSQHIVPSEEYLKKGTEIVSKVLELLVRHGRRRGFTIDRVIYSSSSGKETSVTVSEYECVVFVNEDIPNYDMILREFEEIFRLNGRYENVKRTPYSIQLTVDGFDLDIFPGLNYVTGMDATREDVIQIQVLRTLQQIRSNVEEHDDIYNPSLIEADIQFFKKEDVFVREMARIVKFWFKTLHFDDYPAGVKSMAEIIAVRAAHKEITLFPKKSHLRCFSNVVSLVENFERINIKFLKLYSHPFYVPQEIKEQKPLVLGAVNPYTNVAKVWKPEQITLLREYAAITRKRLDDIENADFICRPNMQYLEYLFQPQPKTAPINKYFKNGFFVDTIETSNIHYPELKICNKELMKDSCFRSELNIFKTYMNILRDMFIASRDFEDSCIAEVSTSPDILKQFQEFIDENIMGVAHREWDSATEKPQDYDMVMTLPVTCEFTFCCVRIYWKQE